MPARPLENMWSYVVLTTWFNNQYCGAKNWECRLYKIVWAHGKTPISAQSGVYTLAE